MFGRRIELFKLFGFAVRVDLSWFLLLVLVTWSLAGAFRANYPQLADATYWAMGLAGALGLFVSVVLHELAHSLVARRHGVVMRGITLFIFGGVAEMTDEPPDAKTELRVAIAGPLASVVIALACWGLGRALPWPAPVAGVLSYLAAINGVLVLFNLVPAFPLDGGRVLRSALWHWKGSLRWATYVTSRIGSGFGAFLIVIGVIAVLRHDFVAGMWWFLLGMFLRGAAQMSYQQLLLRRMLAGEPVRRFMNPHPVTVPRAISVRELVDDYVYRHHFKMFPVVDGERLLGCVTTREVKALPHEEWERQSAGAIARRCDGDNTVGPDADAMEVLGKMSRTGVSRLMVVEGDRLVGVLSLKDLLEFFSRKVELELDAS